VAGFPDCEVVGLCASGEETVQKIKELEPNVLLMDMLIPGFGGLEVLQRIESGHLKTRVIILGNVSKAVMPTQMLQAGAHAFLTKGVSTDELNHAIRKVFAGRRYVSEFIAQRLLNASLGYNEQNRIARLTRREFQIMLMLLDCLKVNQIAKALHLSPKTVNSYRYRIFDKLDVSGNVEMVLFAIKNGIPTRSLSPEVLGATAEDAGYSNMVAEDGAFFRKISRIEKFCTLEDTCLADCLVRHWHCVTPAESDTRVPQKLHSN
jgi:two-component system invasion response regulator UvrY